MTLLIGDLAPDFDAQSTDGPINFHDYIDGSWALLISHPKNFTGVCTTEIGYTAKLKPEFDARNVKVLGVSVDPLEVHQAWASDIEDCGGTALNFPLLADPDRKIADLYTLIHPNNNEALTIRAVYIIGPDKKIKLKMEYPGSVGRSFDEILRVIDSLQVSLNHPVGTPVNWQKGDDVAIASALSDDEAKEKFPKGWDAQKPYLRITEQPED